MSSCWLFFKVGFVPQAGPRRWLLAWGGTDIAAAQPLQAQKRNGWYCSLVVVCSIRKWEFPCLCYVWLSLATSGALQLKKVGRVSGHSLRVWTSWLHWLLDSRNTQAARTGLRCGNTWQKGHCQRLWGNDWEDFLCCPVPWAHYHTQKPPHE